VFAKIRSLASVQTHVRFEVALFVEGFGARFDRTHKVTIPLMFFKVDLQTLSAAVRLSAALKGTLVVFQLFVRLDVVLEVASRHECFFAVVYAANERLIRTLKQIKQINQTIAYMISLMFAKLLNVVECFSAFAAEAFVRVTVDLVLENYCLLHHLHHLVFLP